MNALSQPKIQELLVIAKQPLVLTDHYSPSSSPHKIKQFEELEFEVIQPEDNTGGARPYWIILKGTPYGDPIWKWQDHFEEDRIDIVLDGVEIEDFEELRGRFQ